MAISKIHPIRYSILDAINYITNPDKTDDQMLISSYACSAHTADLEFYDTAFAGSSIGSVKAQHLIQSFAPGEVDAKTAHEIGKKLAMELTGGKHEFVIATHVDKDHIHNHIIFNQVSFVDYKKFRQNIETFHRMQDINDRLCLSYGLSVIKNPQSKAKPYYEYKDTKASTSNRQVFKNTIDSCIPLVASFDELLVMLEKLSYSYKQSGSSYSFKREDWNRYVRLKTLGDRYSYESICSRIKYKQVDAMPYIAPPKSELGLLADLSGKMVELKSPAYQNKVALTQVKRLAATYAFLNEHGINSADEIQSVMEKWSNDVKDGRKTIKELEDQVDSLQAQAEHLKKRDKYSPVYVAYKKSGKSPAFYKEHERELMFYEAACKQLFLQDVPADTSLKSVLSKLESLKNQKDLLMDKYQKDVGNLKQLSTAAKNVDLIMSQSVVKKTKGKDKGKGK